MYEFDYFLIALHNIQMYVVTLYMYIHMHTIHFHLSEFLISLLYVLFPDASNYIDTECVKYFMQTIYNHGHIPLYRRISQYTFHYRSHTYMYSYTHSHI